MPRNKDIDIHNEEVREIMGQIPGRIIRWGLAVIFSIFMVVIVGSYFLKYPKVVSAPITIITYNPPVSLICKTSGKIGKIFCQNKQVVQTGDSIALISNPANPNDVDFISGVIEEIDSLNLKKSIQKIELPSISMLGESKQTARYILTSED